MSKWKPGQRIKHGAAPVVYTLVQAVEDEWLGEPFFVLTLRDETGLVKEVLETYCVVLAEPPEDAPTEEVTP
jgi:hypothetical protein